MRINFNRRSCCGLTCSAEVECLLTSHTIRNDVRPGCSPGLLRALLPKLHHEQRQAKLLTRPSLCGKTALPSHWQISTCSSLSRSYFSPQAICYTQSRYQSMRHESACYSCLNAFETSPRNTVARTGLAAVLQYASAFPVFISVFPVAAFQFAMRALRCRMNAMKDTCAPSPCLQCLRTLPLRLNSALERAGRQDASIIPATRTQ